MSQPTGPHPTQETRAVHDDDPFPLPAIVVTRSRGRRDRTSRPSRVVATLVTVVAVAAVLAVPLLVGRADPSDASMVRSSFSERSHGRPWWNPRHWRKQHRKPAPSAPTRPPTPSGKPSAPAPTAAPTSGSPSTPSAPATTVPTSAPSRTAPSAGPTRPGTVPPTPASGPVYGSVVDTVDAAPPADRRPGVLPRRPSGPEVTAVGGNWLERQPGWIGGRYVMMHPGSHVVLRGHGYVRVRYEIAFFNAGRTGQMVMPTWVGLEGRLFHVASGGWRRMDDPRDNGSWMGNPTKGYITLPPGAQQMWQNEYFWLDGQVTLYNNESKADYNIAAVPVTWQEVVDDISTPRPAGTEDRLWRRYGLVRDTGDDGAPVPQYATRDTPAKAWDVPQRSRLSAP